MQRSNLSNLSIIALVTLALAFVFGYLRVEAQTPVGSGFTYQGRIFDASNAPVQGTCDLSLRLYDQDSGGAQIGATVTITSVAMTDGYFDVTPDFGASSFNGDARWLEIESACPPGSGATTFPRQAVTAVPYALYALNSSAITSTVYVTSTVYYTPTYHLQGWETITGTPASYTPTYHLQGWETITGTPASYTPTAHTQDWTTITGAPSTYTPTYHLQGWATITGTPASYTPTAHSQDWTTITGAPSTYTPTYHLQGWATITGTPASYTPTTHTQDWTTITGAPGTYTPTYHLQGWATITGTPASYTPTAHTQDKTTITGQPETQIAFGDASNILTGSAHLTWDGEYLIAQGNHPYIKALDTSESNYYSELGYENGHAQLTSLPNGAFTFRSPSSLYNMELTVPTASGGAAFNVSGVSPSFTFSQSVNMVSGKFLTALTDGSTGGLQAGSGSDVLWYRGAADTWRTPDSVTVDGKIGIGASATYRLDVGAGGTGNTGEIVRLNSGNGGTSANPMLVFSRNSVAKTYMGVSAGSDGGIVGSVENDLFVRNEGKSILFSTDSGNTAQLWLKNGGPVQVTSNVLPGAANTYNLGSASNYWATIHYHTLTSHSLSVFSTTVTLQNGKEVSCLDALKEIKADPTKKIKGVQHMDYATIPSVALNTAPVTFDHTTYTIKKDGEDGADLDMMVSLVMCADKELDVKLSDFEKRLADLEQKVK